MSYKMTYFLSFLHNDKNYIFGLSNLSRIVQLLKRQKLSFMTIKSISSIKRYVIFATFLFIYFFYTTITFFLRYHMTCIVYVAQNVIIYYSFIKRQNLSFLIIEFMWNITIITMGKKNIFYLLKIRDICNFLGRNFFVLKVNNVLLHFN